MQLLRAQIIREMENCLYMMLLPVTYGQPLIQELTLMEYSSMSNFP